MNGIIAELQGLLGLAEGLAWAAVLAFALLFGVTFLGLRMAARSLGNKSKASAIGGFDRILGLGFGLVKGLVGATLIFTLAALVSDTIYGGASKRPVWMTSSKTYPLLNAMSGALVTMVEERRTADTSSDPEK